MKNWKKLSFLSRSELKDIQNRKLRHFISRQLYPFSTYYRKLFDKHNIKPRYIRTVEDLRIIPFTNKGDLLPQPENPQSVRDFILQPDEKLIKKYWPLNKLLGIALLKVFKGNEYVKEQLEREYRPIFLTATTGTTNQPVSFLYSHHDLNNLEVSGYRLLEVFTTFPDMRAVNLFPYAPHLAFWQAVFGGFAHNTFELSTGGGKVMGTQGNIDSIIKISPDLLIGEPNYLYHLVRVAREQGKNFSSVKRIALGASRVPLGFKEKLSSILSEMGAKDVRVMGTYGFTEAKCAWGECPTALDVYSGYHTFPDKEVFEVIDPVTGENVGEGQEGELVYSSIDARGSCVVRFRTGDLVKKGITYEPCPYCRRTVPRIDSNISRASNIKDLSLSKIKGTLVNLNDIASVLEGSKEVSEWQIEIRKKDNDPFEVDELILYVSLAGTADRNELKAKISDELKAATEIIPNEINIKENREMVERVEMEVSHKAKRIVDKRPK